MNRLHRKLRQERGQALILFVGVFTVIMVAGMIAVDFGLWFSERRGAQTDADLPALAGAQEYMRKLAVPGYPEDALGKATGFFNDNNTNNAGNASLPVPIEAVSPCVKVTVKHDTKALFTGIFGLGPDNIGASAKACAGAITGISGPGGVIPIEMGSSEDPCFEDGQPRYTETCVLESGACPGGGGAGAGPLPRAPGGTPGSPPTDTPEPIDTPTPGPPPTPTPEPCNPRGLLDLQADPPENCSDSGGPMNHDTIVDLIVNGTDGTCRINTTGSCDPDHGGPWLDCVAVQTGNSQAIIDGFRERLALEGSCDDNPADGVESFSETVNMIVDTGQPRTSLYEARVCPDGETSPRIITIIILDSFAPPGPDGHPIVGLAGFYVNGCYDDRDDPPVLDPNCTDHGGPPGHTAVVGQFVKLTLTNGDVDPNPTPSPGTLFGIALCDDTC